MKEVLTMWKFTKMIALVAVTAAVYAAVLIPFKAIVIVPGFTELRPANALPVALGLFFGPAGAWGAAIGNTIGDLMGGTIGIGSIFGAIGNFFFAYVPYKLWNKFVFKKQELDFAPENRGKNILSYIVVALIASLACGFIIAWGVYVLGFVPYSVLAPIIAINNAVMSLTLGLILFLLIGPRIRKWDLLWTQIMDEGKDAVAEKSPLAKIGGYIMTVSIILGFAICLVTAIIGGPTIIIGAVALAGIIIGALMQR